tara:strand:- start:1727 stop:1981 length:255 start_codon:yes stop_codon:yes gene_type:complete
MQYFKETKNKKMIGLWEVKLSGSLATVHMTNAVRDRNNNVIETGPKVLKFTKELDANNVYYEFNKMCDDLNELWDAKYADKLHG